ncbi:aldo/keto reductase [Atribacter laminatus]|jgi:aryl-alcohol dehydrogenase-like predicted oxidoreductase|uniref:General stress protein 69 n=1 Tax=Atribacter laminatus TaxID=2847778 RepID=A0A7T1AKV0_ATRLM|nr:aldo/keto reductase [Atribacter laminatus]QPM67781.1 General stress protein 69 [Atribacter laminatus]
MRTRRLGKTDLELTVIGFGSWAIGGGGWRHAWGPQDDSESIKAIKNALDLGINWIDTAAIYGLGHSEEIVGKAIKDFPKKPIIATKCGLVWDEMKNISNRLKRESIKAEVEASLRRLEIDTIDLYQIHWPIPDEDIEEGWETMAQLVKEGKVRYIGVSNFNISQMKRAQSIYPVASLQPPYSMLKRDVEENTLPYCSQNSIGVVVYSPMQKGLLTGKMTRERISRFPTDDHRRNDLEFNEPLVSYNLEFVNQLIPIAKKHNKTLAQLAIAWVLRRPEVTSAIVGARRPDQIAETALAGDWTLPHEDIDTIEDLLYQRKQKAMNK